MKKFFIGFALLLGLSLFLVACGGGGTASATEVIDMLEGDGYVLEKRDDESMDYYQTNMVNDKYDLNVDVVELYVGYVDGSERWAEIIVLKDASQAEAFYDELMIEDYPDRFVILKDNTVILTFSSDTAGLFN